MQDTFQKSPPFTKEQLDYLDRMYPNRCPDPNMSDREIWMAVGARRLVEHLIFLNTDQPF